MFLLGASGQVRKGAQRVRITNRVQRMHSAEATSKALNSRVPTFAEAFVFALAIQLS